MALCAITAARANLRARNLSLLKWTVFDAYVTTGHWRRFVPSSRAYSQVILARCGQLEPDLLLSFPGRSGRSPRRRLVLMWPIAMSHPMVMVVMATVRSQKAAPISPISPIRYGRRRCIKPRGFLAGDNWQNPRCRSETRSQHTSPRLHAEAPPVIRKTLQEQAHSPPMPTLSCAASCEGIRRYTPPVEQVSFSGRDCWADQQASLSSEFAVRSVADGLRKPSSAASLRRNNAVVDIVTAGVLLISDQLAGRDLLLLGEDLHPPHLRGRGRRVGDTGACRSARRGKTERTAK